MRLRSKPWAEAMLENSGNHVAEPHSLKGKWADRFGDKNEIHLEIGCGKGGFITEMALRNPNVNFIGFERSRKILAMALRNAEQIGSPANLLFINGDASDLCDYFAENELTRIYINFCDPWRNRNKWFKRRLTHRIFLDKYANITNGGSIFFKTDNRALFDFSLDEFTACGWILKNVSYDLHNAGSDELAAPFADNVMTEYEKRFLEMGMPIYRAEGWYDRKRDD